MQIVVTGVNHASAPLSVRERLLVAGDQLATDLRALRELVGQCLLLSTCNRTEIYAQCGHESTGAELLRGWFASRGGLTGAEVERYSYVRAHEAAALHAFRVAAGLDSMIVGEDQILGQLRHALHVARDTGTLGPVLERLGSSALACGKRVRTATELGHRPPSVVSVAIDAAARALGTLARARVVVIGSGETATLAVDHLIRTSAERITIVNRTAERAAALALSRDVHAAVWRELPALLATADLIVSCTSSPSPVLAADTVRSARQAAPGTPLLCVDLGVPRDIDPGVASIAGVTLIDFDQIGAAAGALRSDTQRHIQRAGELVLDEVERFMAWWRERDVAPAIARLHEHARRVGDAEVERALSRLPDLSVREREVVRALASRLTSKLLHEPTVALKRDPEGPNMALVLDRLFGLTPPDDNLRSDSAAASDRVALSPHPPAE